jgi:hypothetical protein
MIEYVEHTSLHVVAFEGMFTWWVVGMAHAPHEHAGRMIPVVCRQITIRSTSSNNT